jgi:hypothetical protein
MRPGRAQVFAAILSFSLLLLDGMYIIEYTYGMSKIKTIPEQQAFLDELAGLWPLAKGSLAQVRKPCIRPSCPACKSGQKHPALLFSFARKGKRVCRYVPAELEPILRQALDNGRRLEARLTELGEELLLRYRQQRG